MVKKAKPGIRIVLAKAAGGQPGTNPGTITRANPLAKGSWFVKWDAPGVAEPIEDTTPYTSSKLKLYTAQAPPVDASDSGSDDEEEEEPQEDEDTHETRKRDFAKLRKSLHGKSCTVTFALTYCSTYFFHFNFSGHGFRRGGEKVRASQVDLCGCL
jgi:hypothetical protein